MKTYSTNYLAEAFEVDRATATRALRDITPDQEQTRGRPTFKIASFARALELHHLKSESSNASAGSVESGAASLTAARVRITIANATAKERENEVAAGKLCHVDAVANEFWSLIMVFREKLLSMPGKIADSLTPYTPADRAAIMEKVKRETYDYMLAVQDGAKGISDGLEARAAAASPPTAIDQGAGHE